MKSTKILTFGIVCRLESQGVKHDLAPINILALQTATLNGIAPNAVEKVLAAFEHMKARHPRNKPNIQIEGLKY